jgi:hypothetical protein
MGTRSLAFEVLAVTHFTPHCLRISLVAEEGGKCVVTSGQEISLAHDGIDGGPSRWIVREFDPRTRHLTAGAIPGFGSLGARRWASSVVPGEIVWGSELRIPSRVWSDSPSRTPATAHQEAVATVAA